MNPLNIIHAYIIIVLLSVMSYWHGHSKDGWKLKGLIYNLILGLIFAVLVITKPVFS